MAFPTLFPIVLPLRVLLGEYGEQEVLDHDASLAFWSDLRDVSPLKEDKVTSGAFPCSQAMGLRHLNGQGFERAFL